jgi:hypothetical protein
MIYVKVHYGLGNQMFQYALARGLSIKLQTDFRLDLSFYKRQAISADARAYCLNQFTIQENIATDEEVRDFIRPSFLRRRFRQFQNIVLPWYRREFIPEKSRVFDPRIFQIPRQVYLAGYWQKEDYFRHAETEIRNDFGFRHPPDTRNSELIARINGANSVSVHIRRGDYLTNSFALSNFEACDLSYYRAAVAHIAGIVSAPHFFVFSDDILWAEENLKIKYPVTFIGDHNKDQPHEDLRLMSHSKHFIIANSSFSWWGAWLGSYNNKVVIGPRKWFKNGDHTLPEKWIRL